MGTQTPSRTYWTPTMERFFIDLMLEHMHRGNRAGHTFNKQAWNDMLAVFNAKFGSQYEKDVLKGRYTTLWKQFNEIKNLLSQKGFSWDETRQMVLAEDYVWDAYIKAHPDARPYKTKAVLNFSDLCLIYGYTYADGRYSLSSHDIDMDDEVHRVHIGDGSESPGPSNSQRARTDWTPAMDQYLIELMLCQQQKGNKLDNTFTKQAWTEMLSLFIVRYGPQHSKRVLRHRFKKLWKYYSDIAVILKHDGFSWDETQQMLVADDDAWNAYIKVNPNVRPYRVKVLPNYEDLQVIFGDAIINGIQGDLHQNKDSEEENLGRKVGNERSRTYWTPPMDRYLIDLLLDQVHRGNKIGHTFITQAWIEMVKLFNANFKSHYDKEVLKNRHKHLRRQYNDVKVLLEQSNFSWNETREMVTAEDHVWDAYVKAHPDARTYRVKTVPSYHKLCVIYGQDSYNGRYSRLGHNLGADAEIPVVLGSNANSQTLVSANSIMDWTPSMDRFFLDLLLEQVHRGNKIDPTLDEETWAHMITSFNDTLGMKCDKRVLENQYARLMKEYDDISILLNQNGFVWDKRNQMVVADDEIWDAYIKEHPDAISYKEKTLGLYSDLDTIFGKGTMVEHSSSCLGLKTEFDNGVTAREIVDICGDFQMPATERETSDIMKKRPSKLSSVLGRCSKVQRTSKEGTKEAFTDMANVVKQLVSKKDEENSVSLETAIDALQAIPDIDDELLLDACDLLEDERKSKIFLALDATLRKKWLLRKLGRL